MSRYDVEKSEYAVLIPIVRTEEGDLLLMEVRSDNVKQPGEVCFPGGRKEPGETPDQTAVRETCEELCLQPGDIYLCSEPVPGVMGDGRKVWSVRGRIDADSLSRLTVSGDEVASVFLLPVSWLANNPPVLYDLAEMNERDLPDKLRNYLSGYEKFRKSGKTYYWEYEGHGIWGLTAGMINGLINKEGGIYNNMSEKKSRKEAIEDLTLALAYLTRFNDGYGAPFNELSWRGYDHDTLNELDEKEYIYAPSRAKYVYLTEEGRARAREILKEIGAEDNPVCERFEFRDIRPEEADRAAEIEQIVFPPNEAVFPDDVREQAAVAPDLFLVAVYKETGEIAGFLNGIATNEMEFRDEFFTDKTLHDPDGKTVMLLGLDVLPEYRKQGLGRELMYTYCRREQSKGRKRLVLTCLPRLVKMYKKMGFRDNGISGSTWGGETWHEMEILL